MKSINYLNILELHIPDDFCCTDVYYRSKNSTGYASYEVKDFRILEQIRSLFPAYIVNELEGIFLQEINPGFNQRVHVDPRTIAINYILESGGETETFFPLVGESYKIELHKWHWFYANRPHTVRNVSTLRRSITLTIKKLPSEQSLDWLETMSTCKPDLYGNLV